MLLLGGAGGAADLADVKAQPNLEKRSDLALANAERALKEARDAYNKGEMEQTTTLVAEVEQSVALAGTSLRETGKNPRKSPKWFKKAEIRTRDLMKKIEAFDQEMNVADRPMLAEVRARVQKVHEDLLLGIMEGRK